LRNIGDGIKQFIGQNLKTLVPRVIGSTVNAKNQKSAKSNIGSSHWSEEKFFEEIGRKFPNQISIYKTIYNKSVELFDDIWWGTGSGTGSFIPNLKINGLFIQLYAVYTYGSIEIQFQHFKNKPPFDDEAKRFELLNKLNMSLNTNITTIDKRPNIKMEVFEKPSTLDAFCEVVEWYIETVKAYYKI
jgi:hypothetical protein